MGHEASCSAGTQVRSFLHVADVGGAFAQLLDSRVEGVINIGSSEALPVAELARRVAALVGRPELLALGRRPSAPGDPSLLLPDVRRLHLELGFEPRYTLAEGLADTIAWWSDRLRDQRQDPVSER
jgi:nucleoside-diphosphate-sugar epimerase